MRVGSRKEEALQLWKSFEDIPINDDDEIEAPFRDFPVGTDRFAIWSWFEDTFDVSVAELSGVVAPGGLGIPKNNNEET